MRGDFSRLTFDPTQRFSGVLFQQGRHLLEADFNELSAIQRYQHRELADMAIGWAGKGSPNFWPADGKLAVGAPPGELVLHVEGWYFVGGKQIEFDPSLERNVPRPSKGKYLLLFLDVFEETV